MFMRILSAATLCVTVCMFQGCKSKQQSNAAPTPQPHKALAPAAATPAANLPMADRLPAGTVAYVSWAGDNPAWDKSKAAELLREPEMQKFLQSVMDALGKAAQQDPDVAAVLPHGVAMAKLAVKHPLAVALTELDLSAAASRPGASAASAPAPTIGVVLLIDLGPDREAFKQHLEAVLAKAPVPPEQITGKAAVRVVPLGEGNDLTFGFAGNMFLLTVGKDMVTKTLDMPAQKSLAAAPAFVKAMKSVGGDNQQLAYYIDAAALIKLGETLELMFGPSQPRVPGILDALGLAKATAIAGTCRVVDGNLLSKCKLFTSAPHTGLLAPAAAKPLDDKDLRNVPAGNSFLVAARFSADDFLKTVRQAIGKIDQPTLGQFDQVLAMFDARLGVSLQRDILDNLGDVWTASGEPFSPDSAKGLLVSVTVRNEQGLRQALDKLDISRQIPGSAQTTKVIDGVKVTSLQLPTPGLSPAWAVAGGRLYVALSPQAVTVAAKGYSGPSLIDSPEVKKLRTKVDGKPVVLMYQSSRYVFEAITAAMSQLRMIQGMLRQNLGVGIELPSDEAVRQWEKYCGPNISTVSADSEGVTFETYGPPIGSAFANAPLTVGATAAMAAALMPTLKHAQELANRAKAMGVLKNMAPSFKMYLDAHNTWPPRLSTLGQDLGMPLDTSRYVYLLEGRNITSDLDPDTIILYEKPELHRNEVVLVLRAGFSGGRLDMASFKKELEASKADIAKHSTGPATAPAGRPAGVR